MTSDIVARATTDLQRAEREAGLIRNRLEAAESEVSDLRAFLRKLEHYTGPAASNNEALKGRRRKRVVNERPPARAGSKSRRLVDAAIDDITQQGKRLEIGHLLQSTLSKGLEIGGKDEKSNLAGYMSRDARVDFVSGLGWGLKKDHGAASEPEAIQTAPSVARGGSNDEPTLDLPDDGADLMS